MERVTDHRMVVEHPTPEACSRYWDILSSVFDQVPPAGLKRGMDRFAPATRFYAIMAGDSYASVLFVTPIFLSGIPIQGIGGVCTRKEFRGLGYGRRVLERALTEMKTTSSTLLWTRLPEYFAPFGFIDASELFAADADGSCPMILFQEERARLQIEALRNLPRDYF